MSFYSTALQRLVLPVLLKRDDRLSALRHWEFLKRSQFWDRQRLLDYQWEKTRQLLDHAYRTTRYYRRVFEERGLTPQSFKSPDDLSRLPMLTRDDVFRHLDDLMSSDYRPEQLQRFTSGGTTGQQAVLYRTQESANIKLGLTWRHEGWIGRQPCDKIALVWPANIDFVGASSWKEQFKSRHLLRQIMFQAGSELQQDLQRTLDQLRNFGAAYIKAFPSALQRLAQYLEASGQPPVRARAVLSTGEPLFENQVMLFRRVFGAEVLDLYASRETGNTACQCAEGSGLHIAMETNLVEFVENDRPVPPGREGEMLITDLTNLAVPLIRYQINDYGIPLAETCTCGRGSQMMSKAIGRLTDDIYSPEGVRHSGHVLGYALAESGPMIGQIQILQESLTRFVVRLTNKPVPRREDFDYIAGVFRRLLGDGVDVTFEVVDRIAKEKSGKVRFVKCLLDTETRARLNQPRRERVEDSGHR